MLFPDTFPDALLETQATQIESYLDQMNRNNRFCLDFFFGNASSAPRIVVVRVET